MSIVGPLKERLFKGVLVFTYVPAEMKEFSRSSSEELRVNKVNDRNSYCGVVLERDDCQKKNLSLENCFEDNFSQTKVKSSK